MGTVGVLDRGDALIDRQSVLLIAFVQILLLFLQLLDSLLHRSQLGLSGNDLDIRILKLFLGFLEFLFRFRLLFGKLLLAVSDLVLVLLQDRGFEHFLLVLGKDFKLRFLLGNKILVVLLKGFIVLRPGKGQIDGRIVFGDEILIGKIDDDRKIEVLHGARTQSLGHIGRGADLADDREFGVLQLLADVFLFKIKTQLLADIVGGAHRAVVEDQDLTRVLRHASLAQFKTVDVAFDLFGSCHGSAVFVVFAVAVDQAAGKTLWTYSKLLKSPDILVIKAIGRVKLDILQIHLIRVTVHVVFHDPARAQKAHHESHADQNDQQQ